ncbi:hypothetical protein ACP6OY_004460 [Cronobacter sakazakii]
MAKSDWEAMRAVFERLDKSALISVNAARKKHKRVNSTPMLAKVDF